MASSKLLLAEDNLINQQVICEILKKLGYENIPIAQNGREVLSLMTETAFDLVIMDVQMPVMDGLEATHIIRSWEQDQPQIIALTANAFDTDREACLAAGMNEFVTKPISRTQLLEVLASFAQAHRVQMTG